MSVVGVADGSGWFVGHIVGQQPPGLFSWVAAIALFGGIGGGIVGRSALIRRCCWAVALLGLMGTAADMWMRSQPPAHPDLTIVLISPGRTAGPEVFVKVCGYTRQGQLADPSALSRNSAPRQTLRHGDVPHL